MLTLRFDAKFKKEKTVSTIITLCVLFVNIHSNGMSIDVPEELEVMVDKASDFAKLEARETVNLKAFVVSGLDVQSLGMGPNQSY